MLHFIIQTAMNLTNSDGGTLYILKDNELRFRIMRTVSKGIDRGGNGEEISIPPVPLKKENICAYAAISRKALNIEDVYQSDLFDFSGPKRYDEMNGYKTKSMVAIPMVNKEDEVIGVMQLINAMDSTGAVRAFTEEEIMIISSFASQTAIALSNMAYLEEITSQMWSFTEALTEAIDARTPYNASHTRNVAKYTALLADYINQQHEAGKTEHFFSRENKDQIVMAAFLHDIGKMIVPLSVMNKQTRMDHHLKDVENRLKIIELRCKVDHLQGDISDEELCRMQEQLQLAGELVHKVNNAGFLNDDLLSSLKMTFSYEYISPDKKEIIPFFSEEEKTNLMIRKGTLTEEERKIMEGHVENTERILKKVRFNRAYKMAPVWAAQHHECINGKGYPKGLKEEQIGLEARILAVADICDALLATDRPYKKPMSKEKAFEIMEDMAKNGMIDGTVVGYLKECI